MAITDDPPSVLGPLLGRRPELPLERALALPTVLVGTLEEAAGRVRGLRERQLKTDRGSDDNLRRVVSSRRPPPQRGRRAARARGGPTAFQAAAQLVLPAEAGRALAGVLEPGARTPADARLGS